MASVFDFTGEKMDMLSSTSFSEGLDAALQYDRLREELGFEWWSVRKEGTELKVTFDEPAIESDVNNILGKIKSVKREDDLCVKVFGSSGNTMVLGMSDFNKTASFCSERLNTATTHQLCSSLSLWISDDDMQENFGDGDIAAHDDADPSNSPLDEESPETASTLITESTTNILVREAAERKVGVFSIPVNALHISTGEDALRAIDPHHIGDLRREMIVEYDNGHEVSLPPAIGVIMNVGTLPTDKHELQRKLEGGKINVRVIDGNHTTQVIKELNETYPEAGCFQKRIVRVYYQLDTQMTAMLALLGNEEASNSLKTADFHKVRIMRLHLKQRFNGLFSQEFQQSMYMMFNAMCPNDNKEEQKRKKSLQHLLRMATTEEKVWTKISNIIESNPAIRISAFRELGRLSVEQSLRLLTQVEKGELRLSEMKERAKTLNVPEDAVELTFQRLRNQKTKQSKPANGPIKETFQNKSSTAETRIYNVPELTKANEEIKQLKDRLLSTEKERDSLKQKQKTDKQWEAEYQRVMQEKNSMLAKVNASKNLETRLIKASRERDAACLKLKKVEDCLRHKESELISQRRTNENLREKIKVLCSKAGSSVSGETEMSCPKLPFTQLHEYPQESRVHSNQDDRKRKCDTESRVHSNQDDRKRKCDTTSAKSKKRNAHESVDDELEVGTRVWAVWGTAEFPDKYKAKIARKTAYAYEVLFDDQARRKFKRPVSSEEISLLTAESLKEAI